MVCGGVQLIHMLVMEDPNYCISKAHPAPRYIKDNLFSVQGRIRAKETEVELGGTREGLPRNLSKFKFPAQRISSVDQKTIESQAVDHGFAKARKMITTNGTIKLVTSNLIIEQTKVEKMWKAGQSEVEQKSSRGWALGPS